MKRVRIVIRVCLVGILAYSTYCVSFKTMFTYLDRITFSPLDFWTFLFPFLIACISMIYIVTKIVKNVIKTFIRKELSLCKKK